MVGSGGGHVQRPGEESEESEQRAWGSVRRESGEANRSQFIQELGFYCKYHWGAIGVL